MSFKENIDHIFFYARILSVQSDTFSKRCFQINKDMIDEAKITEEDEKYISDQVKKLLGYAKEIHDTWFEKTLNTIPKNQLDIFD